MREQRAAMEKELASMQGKAQGSYQELQAMQIKVRPLISYSRTEINIHTNIHKGCMETESCCVVQFQQVREQLESQITRLQQENGILRDAVSSATNQMESKSVSHPTEMTPLVIRYVSSAQAHQTLGGCVNLRLSATDSSDGRPSFLTDPVNNHM